ncbi:GtrA family protein [archaeon]|nr:GtrA family protein [archaeon]
MKKRLLKEIAEFVKFSFVGITTFILHLFLTVLLTEVFGIIYYESYAIALALGWVYNFFFNMWFTFSAKGRLSKMVEKFSVVVLVSTAMNWLSAQSCQQLTSSQRRIGFSRSIRRSRRGMASLVNVGTFRIFYTSLCRRDLLISKEQQSSYIFATCYSFSSV